MRNYNRIIIVIIVAFFLFVYYFVLRYQSNNNTHHQQLSLKKTVIDQVTSKMINHNLNKKKKKKKIKKKSSSSISSSSMSTSSSSSSISTITTVLNFEVFGKVQRVSMRKYAKEAAIKYKVKGWIKNTESKTVQGIAYGSARSIELYKKWLSTKGSPRSIIQNANFEEREITKEDEIPKSFSIKKVLLANGKQWADR